MMKQDLKISLPVYKIGYSLAFIVILSCVHSVAVFLFCITVYLWKRRRI